MKKGKEEREREKKKNKRLQRKNYCYEAKTLKRISASDVLRSRQVALLLLCVYVCLCVCCVLLLLQLCIACQCTCATNHFCPESPRQRVEVFSVLFAGLHYRLPPFLLSLPPYPPATLPSTCFQVSFASLATFCVLLRFLFCSRFRGRLI